MGTITLSLPTAGTTVTAGLHSTNYSLLQTLLNGNLDNTNIASGAAIAASKLAGYPSDATKFLRGDGTWAVAATSVQAAHVFLNANQSIPDSTVTAIAFANEEIDTAGFHDNATNNTRITIPTTGRYQITAQAQFAANSTGYRYIRVRKNGTTSLLYFSEPAISAGIEKTLSATRIVDLVATDYIELIVVQSSGGALNVIAGTDTTFLEIQSL